MEERINNEAEIKEQEIMLPGFRFHPTDEELVGFYLKRKIQQRPLSIELIKQLDIYKHDPWDLPKLASTGEKEWYFYCPRDRKYRNSARPNRVTGAGFWKATGTDRPIYSSEGNKCIGLKKSLVFYKGRAAKGIKTDWMMHEFRLPSLADSVPAKRFADKTIPTNDSWAICRIFKKTNSSAQRALSNSWVSPLVPLHESITIPQRFGSHQNILPTIMQERSGLQIEANLTYNETNQSSSFPNNFPSPDFASCSLPTNPSMPCKPSQFPFLNADAASNVGLLPLEALLASRKCSNDTSSMLLNVSSSASSMTVDFSAFYGSQEHCNTFSSLSSLTQMTQGSSGNEDQSNLSLRNQNMASIDDQWSLSGAWKPNFVWDSPSCSSEMMSSFSTNKC